MVTHKVRMLGDGIIVLPDEVIKRAGLRKDEEVEFFVGDGRIEMHRVKTLRPFTVNNPLLALIGKGQGGHPEAAGKEPYLEVAATSAHAQDS